MKRTSLLLIGLSAVVLAGLTVALLLPRPAQAEGTASTPLSADGCDTQETSFGDLAADAVRTAGNADLGLVAAISFRPGTLPPGPVTAAAVGQRLANPDEVWAVSRLTGAQLRAALEHAVRTAPLPNSSFLQVSGLTLSYSQSAPREAKVRTISVGGAPLNDGASYSVAMPLSLAKGGSGFFKFFTKEAIASTGTTSLAAAIVDYAQRQGSVSYSGTGRINAAP